MKNTWSTDELYRSWPGTHLATFVFYTLLRYLALVSQRRQVAHWTPGAPSLIFIVLDIIVFSFFSAAGSVWCIFTDVTAPRDVAWIKKLVSGYETLSRSFLTKNLFTNDKSRQIWFNRCEFRNEYCMKVSNYEGVIVLQ